MSREIDLDDKDFNQVAYFLDKNGEKVVVPDSYIDRVKAILSEDPQHVEAQDQIGKFSGKGSEE